MIDNYDFSDGGEFDIDSLSWGDAMWVLTEIDPDWKDHWPVTQDGVEQGLNYYHPTCLEVYEILGIGGTNDDG